MSDDLIALGRLILLTRGHPSTPGWGATVRQLGMDAPANAANIAGVSMEKWAATTFPSFNVQMCSSGM